jgi:hypothetical protein
MKTYYAGKKQKGGCKRNPNSGSNLCSVQDYHTVIQFQHKRSTKQAKHEINMLVERRCVLWKRRYCRYLENGWGLKPLLFTSSLFWNKFKKKLNC